MLKDLTPAGRKLLGAVLATALIAMLFYYGVTTVVNGTKWVGCLTIIMACVFLTFVIIDDTFGPSRKF